MPTWHKGNAREDASLYRGWLVGHFVDDTDDVRHSKDVEFKWGIHPAGDERTEWSAGVHDRTILILVSGRWRLDLALDGRHDSPPPSSSTHPATTSSGTTAWTTTGEPKRTP